MERVRITEVLYRFYIEYCQYAIAKNDPFRFQSVRFWRIRSQVSVLTSFGPDYKTSGQIKTGAVFCCWRLIKSVIVGSTGLAFDISRRSLRLFVLGTAFGYCGAFMVICLEATKFLCLRT